MAAVLEFVKCEGLIELRKACCISVPLPAEAGAAEGLPRRQISIIHGEAHCSPPTAAILIEAG